jgi:hypothetical protein
MPFGKDIIRISGELKEVRHVVRINLTLSGYNSTAWCCKHDYENSGDVKH